MRALDPRLLRRARAARVLLGVDAALGIATALVVLVQGTAIAWVVARSFDGDDAVTSGSLCSRLRSQRAPRSRGCSRLPGTARRRRCSRSFGSRWWSAAAHAACGARRHGGRGSRDRGRPGRRRADRVVRALAAADRAGAVVPAAVLVWSATIDRCRRFDHAATLPLVPVFMWLIGRNTESRTLERWQALSLLSSHFLDVVRGLPTLRAFNRERGPGERDRPVGDRYRKATMETLRVASCPAPCSISRRRWASRSSRSRWECGWSR